MSRTRITRVVQAVVLSSVAALMVAGFLLMGGAGSTGSAEAKGDNCRRLSLLRCQPRIERTQTITPLTMITEN